MSHPTRLWFARILGSCLVLIACGGTSTSSDIDSGARAGMSGAGAAGGTGGTTAGGGGRAGAGGQAGGGGRAGAGGQAGGGEAGRCETGQPCSVAGETCSLEEECCPCVLTCTGGIWDEIYCPMCPLICPPEPPASGDSCSTCEVPSECEWDERPMDGPLLVGTCDDGQWFVQPKGVMPTCCTVDTECAPNSCVNGSCLMRIEGHCWGDEQCDPGEFCSGGSVCGCDVVCGGPNRLGVCVPDGLDCCRDDDGCDAGNVCVAGVCKEPLTTGCWRDADCTMLGAVCAVPSVCPCGTSCLVEDQPGTCVIPL